MGHTDNNLRVLATYSTDVEAHIVKGALAAEGIPSILDNEVFSSILPIGFNSIGGVRLLVRDCDYARAKVFLRDHRENG